MGTVNPSSAERQRQAQILRFWRAVEYFSPPKVDRVDNKSVFAVRAGRPLPWEPGSVTSRKRRSANTVWQHTVYAGIFSVDKVRTLLQDSFRVPESEHDFDGRIGGSSAVLCFTVNQDGLLIKDSVALSSCAWAVGRTLSPGPHHEAWLDGFEDESDGLLQRLLDLGDGEIRVERRPTGDDGSEPELGPVAGLMSRLVTGAVKGGLGAAAAAATGGLGPVVGSVAAKAVEEVGGDLIDSAAEKLTDRMKRKDSSGRTGESDRPADAAESAEDQAEPEEPEDSEEPPPELGTKVLDVYDLAAVTRWVAEQLGVAGVLVPDAIRIKSFPVPVKNADKTSGDTFLNSFYADDLERVAADLEKGSPGQALRDYLRSEADLDTMARLDVRQDPETVLRHVRPGCMPLGRWPADNDKPLVLSQQFAVNRILETLGPDEARGVYAVNGPPGTGKTTMLRDLIAALVVQRAERLATLDRPEQAFQRKPRTWRTEETAGKTHSRTIHPLIPKLTGFEMVIASANNGAVENITLEVPGARAIGDAWQDRADYLSGPASILLDDDAWGAVAARLGNRANRSAFVDRFWWGNPPKGSTRPRPADGSGPQPVGLQKLLQQCERAAGQQGSRGTRPADRDTEAAEGPPLGRETWRQAVTRFTTARDRVRRLADERQQISELADRAAGPDALLNRMQRQEADARTSLQRLREEQADCAAALRNLQYAHTEQQAATSAARARLDDADETVQQGQRHVRHAEAALHSHGEAKPGRWRRLVNREALRRWEAGLVPLQTALAAADSRLARREAEHADCRTDLRAAQGRLDGALSAVRRAQHRLDTCGEALRQQQLAVAEAGELIGARQRARAAEQRRLATARERWGAAVPGKEWSAHPGDREAMELRELSSPWMDPEFTGARTELFLAALDLHRALLATAPRQMRRSLQAVMDVVNGQAPPDLPAGTVLAAWQLLFLIVPVVSTTFASVGRMFSDLGAESLGWLLVDEAGQAAPQQVAGALWRSKRAVVVGDPLQLEPVVTLPWTGQKRLASHFSVDGQWAPTASSVQTLADRLNRYGTWLDQGDGENVWLGSPLRVHRRCDRLMFDVSNAIAYDGMMVYGVTRDQDDFPLAERSIWWHVGPQPGADKWSPEEGVALERCLDRICRHIERDLAEQPDLGGLPLTDAPGLDGADKELHNRLNDAVFVVSPFREVVDGIRKVAGKRLSGKRYGTVHTTQGKEADIVVLVLGAGGDQTGSRNWAAQRPNLLNVAVTRARRRLIVIGNHEAWSRHRFFSDLAAHPQLRLWTPQG